MVIHNACCLHEGIADSRSHECKSSLFQVFADGIGKGSPCREFSKRFPPVNNGFSAAESPDVIVKAAELFLNFQECPGIGDGRPYFQTVSNDAGIIHETGNLLFVKGCHLRRVKVCKSTTIALTPVKYRLPAESGLCTVKHNMFEPLPIIVYRSSPLGVMVFRHQGIA